MIPLAILGPLAGKLAKIVWGLIQDSKASKLSETEIQSHITQALADAEKEMSAQAAAVIQAEAKSENWLAQSWRPITALCFLWVVMWFAFFQPALYAWWAVPPLKIGDALLLEIISLLKICLGGYIGGRSLEKIASSFRRG